MTELTKYEMAYAIEDFIETILVPAIGDDADGKNWLNNFILEYDKIYNDSAKTEKRK